MGSPQTIIDVEGVIVFDPDNVSKKHERHSQWKRVAMILLNDDTADYYAWFIQKRYNVILNNPLRGPHITFINDREESMNGKWDEVRNEWHGKRLTLSLSIDVRTNSDFWWLNVTSKDILDEIRSELGLGAPFFSYHMTIGYPNEKNKHHSDYIHGLLVKGMTN